MTPLDLLLGLVRMTIVSTAALGLGHLLLRRRAEAVTRLAATALLCGSGLLAISGTDWPVIWQSSITTTGATPPSANATSGNGPRATQSRSGIALASIGKLLQRLDHAESKPKNAGRSWSIVALFFLLLIPVLRLLSGLAAAVRIHHKSREAFAPRLRRLTSELVDADRGVSALHFRTSSRIDAPCVMAIDRRCIYLPENWNDYGEEELAASISHEIAHLGRNDARWRLLAQVAAAFQYFHPLSHRLLDQLILSQELAADDRAARLLGRQRFILGISRLALRLDAGSAPRHPNGFGMSHSSSFLIRRIKMIRNGLPSHKRRRDVLLSRVVVPIIISIALASAAWSLSADEPVRVAARNAPIRNAQPESQIANPWETFPGLDGYWHLDVDAAMKHPEVGPLLRQGDTMFLTPGWERIVRAEFRNRRGALGLALENVASIAGSATFQANGLETADGGEDFKTSFQASTFVLRMKKGVDWKSISEAFAKDQLHEAIEALVGPEFPEEEAQKLISADLVSFFFENQKDPHQLLLPNEDVKEPPATAPQIKAMWKEHSGDMATLICRVPEFSGHTESPIQKLAEDFHQLAEYFLVGISRSETPSNVRLRIGICPREDSAVKDLARNVTDLLDAAHVKLREAPRDEESADEMTAALLDHIKDCKPVVIDADQPGQTTTVIVDIDLPATLLWHISPF